MSRNALMKMIASEFQSRGYAVSAAESDPGHLHARHAQRPNLVIRIFRDAVRLNVVFRLGDEARRNRAALLEMVNYVNSRSTGTQFCVNPKGDLSGQAWYCGAYTPESFGRFISELWDADLDRLRADQAFRQLARSG